VIFNKSRQRKTELEKTITNKNKYGQTASDTQIEATVKALEANGIHTLIAGDPEEACRLFFSLIPDGAQIYQSASVTLDELGITAEIENSGRYNAIRPKLRAMDRETQGNEIRRLGASPDFMVGSVHAVTQDGHVMAASASGSQLGPYISGAGKVILVVGSQKIVKNLEDGFRRIEEYTFLLEDERMMKVRNMHSSLNKVIVINKERPGRITLIIVKEKIGY
jgi:hypothetical protein